MEKVKDYKVKQEAKIEGLKDNSVNNVNNQQDLSMALAKANRRGKILLLAFIVLFFVFVSTTVQLSSKLNRLQDHCSTSSI